MLRESRLARSLFGIRTGGLCQDSIPCGLAPKSCGALLSQPDRQTRVTTTRARHIPVAVTVECVRVGRLAVCSALDADLSRPEGSPLTPREIEVLSRLADGAKQQAAAQDLGISLQTVRSHLKNAREKLHARSLGHLVAKAAYLGLVIPGR